jgi:hypothetical protein
MHPSRMRHADLNTTLGIYGHRGQPELETAMVAYASWLEQQRENEIVPPKLTAESAHLSQKVEAVGIEPAERSVALRQADGSVFWAFVTWRSRASPRTCL